MDQKKHYLKMRFVTKVLLMSARTPLKRMIYPLPLSQVNLENLDRYSENKELLSKSSTK